MKGRMMLTMIMMVMKIKKNTLMIAVPMDKDDAHGPKFSPHDIAHYLILFVCPWMITFVLLTRIISKRCTIQTQET